jgi:hypothetical protein
MKRHEMIQLWEAMALGYAMSISGSKVFESLPIKDWGPLKAHAQFIKSRGTGKKEFLKLLMLPHTPEHLQQTILDNLFTELRRWHLILKKEEVSNGLEQAASDLRKRDDFDTPSSITSIIDDKIKELTAIRSQLQELGNDAGQTQAKMAVPAKQAS